MSFLFVCPNILYSMFTFTNIYIKDVKFTGIIVSIFEQKLAKLSEVLIFMITKCDEEEIDFWVDRKFILSSTIII